MDRVTIWNDNMATDNFALYFESNYPLKPDSIILTSRDDDKNNAEDKWQFIVIDKDYVDNADAYLQNQISDIKTEISDDYSELSTAVKAVSIGSYEKGLYTISAQVPINIAGTENNVFVSGLMTVNEIEGILQYRGMLEADHAYPMMANMTIQFFEGQFNIYATTQRGGTIMPVTFGDVNSIVIAPVIDEVLLKQIQALEAEISSDFPKFFSETVDVEFPEVTENGLYYESDSLKIVMGNSDVVSIPINGFLTRTNSGSVSLFSLLSGNGDSNGFGNIMTTINGVTGKATVSGFMSRNRAKTGIDIVTIDPVLITKVTDESLDTAIKALETEIEDDFCKIVRADFDLPILEQPTGTYAVTGVCSIATSPTPINVNIYGIMTSVFIEGVRVQRMLMQKSDNLQSSVSSLTFQFLDGKAKVFGIVDRNLEVATPNVTALPTFKFTRVVDEEMDVVVEDLTTRVTTLEAISGAGVVVPYRFDSSVKLAKNPTGIYAVGNATLTAGIVGSDTALIIPMMGTVTYHDMGTYVLSEMILVAHETGEITPDDPKVVTGVTITGTRNDTDSPMDSFNYTVELMATREVEFDDTPFLNIDFSLGEIVPHGLSELVASTASDASAVINSLLTGTRANFPTEDGTYSVTVYANYNTTPPSAPDFVEQVTFEGELTYKKGTGYCSATLTKLGIGNTDNTSGTILLRLNDTTAMLYSSMEYRRKFYNTYHPNALQIGSVNTRLISSGGSEPVDIPSISVIKLNLVNEDAGGPYNLTGNLLLGSDSLTVCFEFESNENYEQNLNVTFELPKADLNVDGYVTTIPAIPVLNHVANGIMVTQLTSKLYIATADFYVDDNPTYYHIAITTEDIFIQSLDPDVNTLFKGSFTIPVRREKS